MDIKATPNSHRYKEDMAKSQEKKIQRVVNGTVRTKKKSEVSKFKDSIFAEDVTSVKNYLFMDVLVPTIKRAISEIITNGVDMMLYGEVRNGKKSSVSHVSYRDYSKADSRSYANKSVGFDLDDIVLASRGDGEVVIEQMEEVLDVYGIVSVADLYEMIGKTAPFTANRWGWTSIRTADVIRGRGNDYYLKLPRPKPID